MIRRTAALAALAVCTALLPCASHAQPVTPERIVRAASEPQNWLTYSGTYASQRYTTLRQITPQNVRNLEQKWVLQGQVLGAWQSSPLVVDGIMYLTQRPNDVLALDAKTGRVFWQYRYNNSADQRVCCGANNRGLAIHGDTLFMGTLDAHLDRDRREERPAAVEHDRRRFEARVLDHDGAARDQGQSDRRHGRRRIRHPRLHRGLRRAHRQGGVAVRNDSAPRPTRQRDLERRRLGARRRVRVAHGLLRSRAQSHVLGRRQSGTRLESGSAPRRQPLLRLRRGARRGHGRAQVALPVHAERRLRLRRGADPGPRRHALARRAAPPDALGQPQRLLLRARPRVGRVPPGHAVRQSELGERARREGPADPNAAAARRGDLARQPGRHELVLAVVQPAHGALLSIGLGRLRVVLSAASSRSSSSAETTRAAATAR